MATLASYLEQLKHLPFNDAEDLAAASTNFSEQQLMQTVIAKIRVAPYRPERGYLKIQIIDQDGQELCCFAGLFPHQTIRSFMLACKPIASSGPPILPS